MVKRTREIKRPGKDKKPTPKHQNKEVNHSRKVNSDNRLTEFLQKNMFAVFFVLLAVLLLIVFRDYIFMNSLFLFKDIGSDTINTFYPSFVLNSELAKAGLHYTFRSGMGAEAGGFDAIGNDAVRLVLNPFSTLLYTWESTAIAYGLGITELLKILTAGIIFYFYLKSMPLQKTTAVFGALAFTFSGFMMGGAGWYLHSIHWVYVALLLFGFEQA
ncbi:MAG: hypothetical protein U9N85_07520, partial [Bacteroidota bacterium]|nr:hypothetical protein [Bacteroidota bacterium]